MVVSRIPARAFFGSAFLLSVCVSAFPQQSNLQIGLLPNALVSNEAANEPETDSYNTVMAKRPAPFRPNDSDNLIGKAEERFQNGKRLFQVKDIGAARREFDTAIDLMLRASDHPTDRRLFEDKLEQMVDSIHRFDLAGLGAGAPVEEAQFEKAPLEDILPMTFSVDPRIKGKVVDEVKATSSQLPLTVNDAVLGYINYFSGRGHRTIVAGLERAARYRPMISRILAEEGVPQELIHLAQAESGFLPRAISNKAAVGMWQFVQFRGRQYGLNQTSLTDDRLDPEKATRAAAHHLHDLYNEFGNWYLAIAAYNCGPGNIEKAVERTGYADFWELRDRHVLPLETTNYVPIILAMTIMTKNAAAYGLTDINPEPALDYDTVKVSSPTHLALVSDLTDTPVSQLLAMNPALIRNVAPANYELHVPKAAGEPLQSALDLFPSEARASWRLHRVEAGETLSNIAQQYKISAATIANANRLTGAEPQAGDKLIIPATFREAAPASLRYRHGVRKPSHSQFAAHRGLARGRSIRVASAPAHAKHALVRPVNAHAHGASARHRV